MDMAEALNGKVGDVGSYRDFGYFGLLGADFDENGIASGNYRPKPSYYAFRTLCSVFSDGCKPCAVSGIVPTVEYSGLLWDNDYDLASGKCYSFTKPNGSVGITYWRPTDVLTDTFESTVSFTVTDELYDLGMRLVDLRNGSVYSIPENMIRKDANGVTLLNLPVYDSPLLLTAGEFCEIMR